MVNGFLIVSEFYKDFTAYAGIEGVSKDAVKAAAGANQNILQRAAAIAAEIFAPLIPAIITGGLILGFNFGFSNYHQNTANDNLLQYNFLYLRLY